MRARRLIERSRVIPSAPKSQREAYPMPAAGGHFQRRVALKQPDCPVSALELLRKMRPRGMGILSIVISGLLWSGYASAAEADALAISKNIQARHFPHG